MTDPSLATVVDQFKFRGKFLTVRPYGDGHIHDTWVLHFRESEGRMRRYILQRINRRVFSSPENLMENLARVTAHLYGKILAAGGDPTRETLNLIPTAEGKWFLKTRGEEFWRAFCFIEGAQTYPTAIGLDHVYQVAKAYGRFLKQMSDLPIDALHETIPDFHHTARRYEALMKAVDQDLQDRAGTAREEIRFAEGHASEVSSLTDRLDREELPLWITHNDTKISNVLIDDQTAQGICVIDLDTVMPGSSLYDFGDLVRSACNPAGEETQDLSGVLIDLERFGHCVRGYLAETGELLTPAEIELFPVAAKLIALELGIRFLTDYLTGDTYFPAERPGHNLDRCRVQFRLVEAIEASLAGLRRIVKPFSQPRRAAS
jgi:Ser/Thr protein kinase RdoA (MazF antagonist)